MALALMFASPTLNVVVLMMAFSLLPLYMAVTKLLFNLLVIFALVPLLSKWLARSPVTDITKLERALPPTESSDARRRCRRAGWPTLGGLLERQRSAKKKLGSLALQHGAADAGRRVPRRRWSPH